MCVLDGPWRTAVMWDPHYGADVLNCGPCATQTSSSPLVEVLRLWRCCRQPDDGPNEGQHREPSADNSGHDVHVASGGGHQQRRSERRVHLRRTEQGLFTPAGLTQVASHNRCRSETRTRTAQFPIAGWEHASASLTFSTCFCTAGVLQAGVAPGHTPRQPSYTVCQTLCVCSCTQSATAICEAVKEVLRARLAYNSSAKQNHSQVSELEQCVRREAGGLRAIAGEAVHEIHHCVWARDSTAHWDSSCVKPVTRTTLARIASDLPQGGCKPAVCRSV